MRDPQDDSWLHGGSIVMTLRMECRTYGAWALGIFGPALTRWANLLRASGAADPGDRPGFGSHLWIQRVEVDSFARVFRMAWRASAASWAAWEEAGGRPPMSAAILSEVISVRSWMVRPVIFSVRREAQAIEAVQPRQRKRASCTIPAFMRTAKRRI